MSQPGKSINDNFVAMVTAKAQVTLPLGEFQPKSTLVTAEHHLERARFPRLTTTIIWMLSTRSMFCHTGRLWHQTHRQHHDEDERHRNHA